MQMHFRLILTVFVVVLIQGCFPKRWEIKQLETTFVNQADNKEYVQKNAVLLNGDTGECWVFSSDSNSHYFWEKVPVSGK